jgi:site-specific DNA-methyltransferase (cytosine-N4-specific)
MKNLLQIGYKEKKRPSGHEISENFSIDNGAAIPPNLIAAANTESNGRYLNYCKDNDIKPHPARYPSDVPEFFIRMLTDPDDMVIDPFAGSCVTGDVCERIGRKWICVDTEEEYLYGALGRFREGSTPAKRNGVGKDGYPSYNAFVPGFTWNGKVDPPLPAHGGKYRPKRKATPK